MKRAVSSAAQSAKQRKDAKLRQIIDLYHASASFPHRANMLECIDRQLLGRSDASDKLPKTLSLSELAKQQGEIANRFQSTSQHSHAKGLQYNQDTSLLSGTGLSASFGQDSASSSHAKQVATMLHPESTSDVVGAERLQRRRLQQIMDALHGTSTGTQAGLEAVRERGGDP